MHYILTSACLLGQPVRYDGKALPVGHPLWQQWQAEGRLLAFCPECAGGLPTPRAPAEIIAGDGAAVLDGLARVVDKSGQDVTEAFVSGAMAALQLAQSRQCRLAVLTDKSPSCGSLRIYDGGFSGRLQAGSGVTAALLRRNGIMVFAQDELEVVANKLAALEAAMSGQR
ncbi:hypothetical protein A9J41_11985 [Laribacter hongkongensis]|uniref:DUF523 domain-containing protein n=1 Tax=Laribacter hongkongensis TaxID=168471 RepID=UPI00187856F3|nr:DUF523 domain-containing protein [Laribacter hongkongensis]MBE5528227.1 hypothetical protein [Laribacter hongkongensis]